MEEKKDYSKILTQSQYIRMICMNENVSTSELADRLGKSPANFSNMLARSNFHISDMKNIADALGYEFTYEFKRK